MYSVSAHDPSVISASRSLDRTVVHGQPTEAFVSARGLFLLFYVGITGLLSASVVGFITPCPISLFVASEN
jgi:hypothetical protein